ncbi:peptidase [Acetobacter indonesiensis]|uniref:murein hydrolase activator EnvC family protein n=1 Tax=Acetobacter indonesiensis TaxID=104101 RepID=UPI000A372697|nr:peptidoglycan DD-metalloendopeptidase family protein [Acetobacter indonesiensis]OUI95528.1 peptidase [Acetobacter indonesiensis]
MPFTLPHPLSARPYGSTRLWRCGLAALMLAGGTMLSDGAWAADHKNSAHKPSAQRHTNTRSSKKPSPRHTTGRSGSSGAASSGKASTPSTKAELQAEQSVKQAREALQTTQAQRDTVNRQKAAQAAAVEASRAKNEAAQTLAIQSAAKAAALSTATVAATSQLQTTEQQIADLDSRIAEIRKEQANLRAALEEDAKALSPVLPLAERLSLYPSDTLLAAPVPQGEAVTGFLVLRGLSRELEHQAEDMRTRQEKLTVLDTELTTHLTQLGSLQKTQTKQRDVVKQQALKARDAQRQANAAARAASLRLEDATRKASSLQDAVSRLDALQANAEAALQKEVAAAEKAHKAARDEAARRAAEERAAAARRKIQAMQAAAGPGLSEHATHTTTSSTDDNSGSGPSGGGTRPVAGSLVSTWGSATESGPATGITYRTPAGASVRTPCSGRVDFAGPFRTYGQMIILNCGQHYRFVMAGLGGLDVETGQSLTKGAPIGHMGGSGTLFIQLRHGQKAVNPAPFL